MRKGQDDQSYGEEGALREPEVGGGVLRGTCHMLSESGLKQKPSKSKQDRQPDPPCNGGGEIQGTVCVCAHVQPGRRVFLLNEVVVAVATNFFFFFGGGHCWTYLRLSNIVKNLTLDCCLSPSNLYW